MKTLLNDLCSCDDPFFHFLHHVSLDLHCQIQRSYGFSRAEPSFLQEGLQVIISISFELVIVRSGLILFELLSGFIIEGFLDGEYSVPHLFVLLRDGALFVPDGLVALLLFREQVLVLLLDERIIFLFAGINFSVAQNLIPRILFLDGFDLALIHVVESSYLFLLEVYRHLGDLFFGRHEFVALPLLTHLQDLNLPDVVIVIKVIFGSVHTLGFILHKSHAPADNLVIPVFIELSCFLSDLFDTLDQPVVITVGIVGDDAHPPVYFDELLPVREFARAVVLDGFELIRISISALQLIASVFVEVSEFFDS